MSKKLSFNSLKIFFEKLNNYILTQIEFFESLPQFFLKAFHKLKDF